MTFRMKRGFFGFLGNHLSYTIYDKVFWIILTIICLFLIMVFKSKLASWYYKKDHKKDHIILGILFLCMNFSSRIIYWVGGYPHYWELLPFNLCRFTFLLLGIFLVINKPDLIKWIVIPMFFGASIAIMAGALDSNSQFNWLNHKPKPFPVYSDGIDNYFYWDYYITHLVLVISAVGLWSVRKWKFSVKDMLCFCPGFTIVTIIMFCINLIINNIDPSMYADYFFMGKHSAFEFPKWLGILGKFPWKVIPFFILGWAYCFMVWFFWIFQGKWNIGKWKWYKKTTNPIVWS